MRHAAQQQHCAQQPATQMCHAFLHRAFPYRDSRS
jgi:hypothetical protein